MPQHQHRQQHQHRDLGANGARPPQLSPHQQAAMLAAAEQKTREAQELYALAGGGGGGGGLSPAVPLAHLRTRSMPDVMTTPQASTAHTCLLQFVLRLHWLPWLETWLSCRSSCPVVSCYGSSSVRQ